MPQQIRVGLIDWDVHVRAGRRLVLDSVANLTVVFEGRGEPNEIELIQQNLIDVLLIEQRLAVGSGTNFVATLRAASGSPADVPSVIITAPYLTDALRLESLEVGAFDCLSLEEGPADLIAKIDAAVTGKAAMTLGTLRSLLISQNPEQRIDQGFLQLVASQDEKIRSSIERFRASFQSDSDTQLGRLGLNEHLEILGAKYLTELAIKLFRNGLLNAG